MRNKYVFEYSKRGHWNGMMKAPIRNPYGSHGPEDLGILETALQNVVDEYGIKISRIEYLSRTEGDYIYHELFAHFYYR
jgi:hypothetical protein